MRICLIIPPSGFLLDEKVFPTLGVLKVGASLEQAGHQVEVCDLSGLAGDDLTAELAMCDAEVYGITATMPQMPMAAEIAGCLRYSDPECRLVLGGPHPTLLHASAKRGVKRAQAAFAELEALFDVIVCGDGDHAIHLALAADPPKVIDADEPTTPLFLTKADLNAAPLPARHLIDIGSYRYQIDGVPTQSMIAQLGCPFGCNFCGGRRSPFLRRVRTRETLNVIAEMRSLYETYGTRGFMFLDDELNVNTQFIGLLGQMIGLQRQLGVEFRLRGLLKSELVTEEMAALMYQAGFRQVLVGFESGDPRMLLNMNKHATVEDNTRCVRVLKAAGITVKALMSFGHPGESVQSCHATRDWLLDVAPDDFDVTIITVYPGTPYYEDARHLAGRMYAYSAKNGDVLYMTDVDHLKDVNFYKGIPGEYQSFVWTDYLHSQDLVDLRDSVENVVRRGLKIPYPTSAAAKHYEHSMGAR